MRTFRALSAATAAIFFTMVCVTLNESYAEAVTKPLVLVAGATGKTSSLVVAQLQAEGYPVRAFVRSAEKAVERLGPDVEAVVGDLRNPASIDVALDGVQAIINAAGSGVPAAADNLPEHVDHEGARNLADAAAEADVEHYVVCVAALGHEEARGKVFEIYAKDGEPQGDFSGEFAALAGY